MRRLLVMCLAVGLTALQGCKCQDETAKVEGQAAPEKKEPTPAEIEHANLVKQIKETVKIEEITEGDGAEAIRGHEVVVHYTSGVQGGNGFDSSYARNTPFTFTLGAGQVTAAWDECIEGMKVGGKRRLIVPPELGFGKSGLSNVIPPDATLVYEIELLEVR